MWCRLCRPSPLQTILNCEALYIYICCFTAVTLLLILRVDFCFLCKNCHQHRVQQPRFPIRRTYFNDDICGIISMFSPLLYSLVFAPFSRDLVTLTFFKLLTLSESCILTVMGAHTNFEYPTMIICSCWLINDSMWSHFHYATCNGYCRCAMSRDLSSGGGNFHIFEIPDRISLNFVTFRALRRRFKAWFWPVPVRFGSVRFGTVVILTLPVQLTANAFKVWFATKVNRAVIIMCSKLMFLQRFKYTGHYYIANIWCSRRSARFVSCGF